MKNPTPTHAQQSPDHRFMAAAIRLARQHFGRTGTNPSVGTLIVKDGIIIGRGITALGGRPHAETEALTEAGEGARGATAYVTLEPCAHHGRTPPCAQALIAAGITRVVIAADDPDPRVSGKGANILRRAGIEVAEGSHTVAAREGLSPYLTRSVKKRPEVTLKLGISADGMIGSTGAGQVAITGSVSRAMVHLMRAESDVILVGVETALNDDPELTCRLPGLADRSPIRIVLDGRARLPVSGKLVQSARHTPVWVATLPDAGQARQQALVRAGCRIIACENDNGRIALPELLEDLAAQGIASVLVEGGARVAQGFLSEGLVDRIALFSASAEIGPSGVASPVTHDNLPSGFTKSREALYGSDRFAEFQRA